MWKGEPAFLLGGGPSLKDVPVEALRGRGRVIAINDAFRLAPWADLMFWADRTWMQWNHEAVGQMWGGGIMATRTEPNIEAAREWPVKVLQHNRDTNLSRRPEAVAGWCGGSNALNIAWLAGASPIILLGFDGGLHKGANWHTNHKTKCHDFTYPKYIRPSLERMAVELRKEQAHVLNATPDSALECFPTATLDEVLSDMCL